jgi:hypothetical protein
MLSRADFKLSSKPENDKISTLDSISMEIG